MGIFSKIGGKITGSSRRDARDSDLRGLIADFDPGPRPDAPKFKSKVDPKTQLLREELLLDDRFSGPFQRVLEKFRTEALRPEDEASAAAKVLQERLKLTQQRQEEGAIQSSATRGAEQRSQLARSGGLSGGASQNLARLAQRDLNRQLQGVRQSGAEKELGITAGDLQNRQGLLGQLSGLEQNQQAFSQQGRQFNIQQALQEEQNKRLAEQNTFTQQMKAFGAGKQSQAILGAGLGAKK